VWPFQCPRLRLIGITTISILGGIMALITTATSTITPGVGTGRMTIPADIPTGALRRHTPMVPNPDTFRQMGKGWLIHATQTLAGLAIPKAIIATGPGVNLSRKLDASNHRG
jgi:hypothetical protein